MFKNTEIDDPHKPVASRETDAQKTSLKTRSTLFPPIVHSDKVDETSVHKVSLKAIEPSLRPHLALDESIELHHKSSKKIRHPNTELSAGLKAGMDTLLSTGFNPNLMHSFGISREEFMRLNPEALAAIYDQRVRSDLTLMEHYLTLLQLSRSDELYTPIKASDSPRRNTTPNDLLFFTDDATQKLTAEQIQSLSALSSTRGEKKIILLVDDNTLDIKMVTRNLVPYLTCSPSFTLSPQMTRFKSVNAIEWQKQKFTIDVCNDWIIVCAANAYIAYAIVQNIPDIAAIITDYQMPGTMQGTGLVANIRALERAESRCQCPIILNTTCEQIEVQAQIDGLNALYIKKASSFEAYKVFFDEHVFSIGRQTEAEALSSITI